MPLLPQVCVVILLGLSSASCAPHLSLPPALAGMFAPAVSLLQVRMIGVQVMMISSSDCEHRRRSCRRRIYRRSCGRRSYSRRSCYRARYSSYRDPGHDDDFLTTSFSNRTGQGNLNQVKKFLHFILHIPDAQSTTGAA